jgi:SsrA-binding protein
VNILLPRLRGKRVRDEAAIVSLVKTVAQNRRAKFDYEIIDTVEAGVILTGQEAKSARMGQVNLLGSYVSFLGGKPMIKHMKISPYKYAGVLPDYDPGHDRELLLSKHQLQKLEAQQMERGIAIIPLEVHAGKFIKVLLGVGKGRKRLDKRERIKEREVGRRMRQGKEE